MVSSTNFRFIAEGRRQKEEGRRQKEEGRRKKAENISLACETQKDINSY